MKLSIALFIFRAYCVIQVASDANYAITFDAQAPISPSSLKWSRF
jgi:hypothetical protein